MLNLCQVLFLHSDDSYVYKVFTSVHLILHGYEIQVEAPSQVSSQLVDRN